MSRRVALIDSCGNWPGAREAAAFASDGRRVQRRAAAADGSGHGSRIARLFADSGAAYELLLGQVFLSAAPASSAAVAAAIDWAVAEHATLIHMSLGLGADRTVLAGAVERAVGAGCILVAAMPARGAAVFPAAYPGVVRATADARCAPGELSCLGSWLFGGCAQLEAGGADASGAGEGVSEGASGGVGAGGARGGGASVGAAWVTRSILSGSPLATAHEAIAALTAGASYFGPEHRGRC